MPGKHKYPPIGLRLPEADRLWLLAYAKRTGQPVNRILAQWVAEKRAGGS
jgi:hypothetical protein